MTAEPLRPPNFGWLLEGELAGSGLYWRPEEIAYLHAQGIRAAVSLFETAPPPDFLAALAAAGIAWLHAPIADFTAPDLDLLERVIAFVDASLAAGTPVVVSCGAGLGRTGTILAGCLVARGQSPDDAIAAVRARRPGSIETSAQEALIRRYAASRREGGQ